MSARRISRLELTAASPDRLARFYADAFGATVGPPVRRTGEHFARATGLRDAAATVVPLRIGATIVELHGFDRPGRPIPPDARSNDLSFQHFALITTDIAAAWHRARVAGARPIGASDPVRLPASSGGATAIKFRDPDGHPLELLQFPPGHAPPRWRDPPPDAGPGPGSGPVSGPVRGIDHTAIAVADTGTTERFHAAVLGLAPIARSLNTGPEQEALDGSFNAVVEVTGLAPIERDGPHLELLCNRVPADGRPIARDWRADDIGATRTVFAVDDLAAAVAAAIAAGARFVTPRLLAGTGPDAPPVAALHDPDGHLLVLEPSNGKAAPTPG